MARIEYRRQAFRSKSRELIKQSNDIVEEYRRQGYRLTLRQLYYQHVTRNTIPNCEKSYKSLSTLVTDARYAGEIDWEAVEDRTRQPRTPAEWNSPAELVETAIHAFRLPRWQGQEYYAELWVEKEALAGILQPLASEHHVTLMVNRGYPSATAVFDGASRFIGSRRKAVLFYLGDLDPSGEDMVRDIRERLHEFEAQVIVEKIAITPEQVAEFNPPPNPAKMSDTRALGFVAKHGGSSYEVDALPPQELARIVRERFATVLDRDAMDAVVHREAVLKERLREALQGLGGVA